MKRPREEPSRYRPRLVWHQDHTIAAAQAAGKAPGPRECHVMLTWGEKLIVFAGNDNITRMSDMYCFDTVLNKWSQIVPKNDAPGQRSALTAALVGLYRKRPFVSRPLGCKVQTAPMGAAARIGLLQAARPRSQPPILLPCYADDRYIVIFGGWDGTGETGDVHCFDLVTLLWSKPPVKGEQPVPRHFHSSVYMPYHRRILVYGGYDGEGWRGDVFCLDVDTWTWERAALPPGQRAPGQRASGSTVVVQWDKMLLFGGYDGHTFLDDMWILHTTAYDPAESVTDHPPDAAGGPGTATRIGAPSCDSQAQTSLPPAQAPGPRLGMLAGSTQQSRPLRFAWEQIRKASERPMPGVSGSTAGSCMNTSSLSLGHGGGEGASRSRRQRTGVSASAVVVDVDMGDADDSMMSAGASTAASGGGGGPSPPPLVSYATGRAWPQHRSGHAAVVVDNCMLITGGRHKGGRYKDSWVLNLDDLQWHRVSHKGDVWSERKTHSLGVVGTRCWLFGGHVGRCWGGDMFITDLTPVLRSMAPRLTTCIPPSSLLSDLAHCLGMGQGSVGQAVLAPVLQAQGAGMGLLTDDRAILPLRSDPSTSSAPPTSSGLYRHALAAPAVPPGGSKWSELVPWVRPPVTVSTRRVGRNAEGEQLDSADGGWATDSSEGEGARDGMDSSSTSSSSSRDGEGDGQGSSGSSSDEEGQRRRRRRRRLRAGYIRVRQRLSRPLASAILPNARYLTHTSSSGLPASAHPAATATGAALATAGEGQAGHGVGEHTGHQQQAESDWSASSDNSSSEEGDMGMHTAGGAGLGLGGGRGVSTVVSQEEVALFRSHPGLALGLGRHHPSTAASRPTVQAVVTVTAAGDVSMASASVPATPGPARVHAQGQGQTPAGAGLNSSTAGQSMVSGWSLDSSTWSLASGATPWSGARAALGSATGAATATGRNRSARPAMGPAGAYSLESYEHIFRERYGGRVGSNFLAGPLSPLNLSAAGMLAAPSPSASSSSAAAALASPAPAAAPTGSMLPPPVPPMAALGTVSHSSSGATAHSSLPHAQAHAQAQAQAPVQPLALAPPFPPQAQDAGGRHSAVPGDGPSPSSTGQMSSSAEGSQPLPTPTLGQQLPHDEGKGGDGQWTQGTVWSHMKVQDGHFEAGVPTVSVLHAPASAMLALPPAEVHGVPFPDVCVMVGSLPWTGQEASPFYLHRAILATRCAYLKAMLLDQHARMAAVLAKEGMVGVVQAGLVHPLSSLPLVHLPDIDTRTFTALVRWLYIEQLPPQQELEAGLVAPLLAESQKMGLKRLSHLCQRYLEYRLSVETAPSLLELADTHGARHLRRAAVSFMLCRGEEMSGHDSFIGMRAELLREMLQRMKADKVQRAAVKARRKLAKHAASAAAATAASTGAAVPATATAALDAAQSPILAAPLAGHGRRGPRLNTAHEAAVGGAVPPVASQLHFQQATSVPLPAQVRAALHARISAAVESASAAHSHSQRLGSGSGSTAAGATQPTVVGATTDSALAAALSAGRTLGLVLGELYDPPLSDPSLAPSSAPSAPFPAAAGAPLAHRIFGTQRAQRAVLDLEDEEDGLAEDEEGAGGPPLFASPLGGGGGGGGGMVHRRLSGGQSQQVLQQVTGGVEAVAGESMADVSTSSTGPSGSASGHAAAATVLMSPLDAALTGLQLRSPPASFAELNTGSGPAAGGAGQGGLQLATGQGVGAGAGTGKRVSGSKRRRGSRVLAGAGQVTSMSETSSTAVDATHGSHGMLHEYPSSSEGGGEEDGAECEGESLVGGAQDGDGMQGGAQGEEAGALSVLARSGAGAGGRALGSSGGPLDASESPTSTSASASAYSHDPAYAAYPARDLPQAQVQAQGEAEEGEGYSKRQRT